MPRSRFPLTAYRLPTPDQPHEFPDGIVVPIDDALLERNDRVVGDGDPFRAHLRAALRDVAVPDPA